MKYYRITKDGFSTSLEVGKIYPETFVGWWKSFPLKFYVQDNIHVEEVPAGEYFVQEGKLPEYFLVKNVGDDHPLYKKYTEWLFSKYNIALNSISTNYSTSLSSVKGQIVYLTLEQWDQIVNKQEVMKEKEIIGWKLKESCKQYEEAAGKIVDNPNLCSWTKEGQSPYDFKPNSNMKKLLEKAGVLELWFELVYKEEPPKRWRAEEGEKYYYVNGGLKAINTTEYDEKFDNEAYDFGNYFKTKEEAQMMADKFKALLNEHHKK